MLFILVQYILLQQALNLCLDIDISGTVALCKWFKAVVCGAWHAWLGSYSPPWGLLQLGMAHLGTC